MDPTSLPAEPVDIPSTGHDPVVELVGLDVVERRDDSDLDGYDADDDDFFDRLWDPTADGVDTDGSDTSFEAAESSDIDSDEPVVRRINPDTNTESTDGEDAEDAEDAEDDEDDEDDLEPVISRRPHERQCTYCFLLVPCHLVDSAGLCASCQ